VQAVWRHAMRRVVVQGDEEGASHAGSLWWP
jgi:hypothetical protein